MKVRVVLGRLGLLGLVVLLAACAARQAAPVRDAPITGPRPSLTAPAPTAAEAAKPTEVTKLHTIQRGETLIGIALQHGLDYRELAAWNNIENPNVIRVGIALRLTAPDGSTQTLPLKSADVVATPLVSAPAPDVARPPANSATSKVEPRAGRVAYTDPAWAKANAEATANPLPPVATAPVTAPVAVPAPAPTTVAPAAAAGTGDAVDWAWPVPGKVTAAFTEASKGIDIAGTRGAPVLAAAAGKVIYNQSGLRGYGRLVIIKHNETWLSAYAHNERVLVAEGDVVKKGQKIAEMGSSDSEAVKLHFEVRSKGKPVDPVKVLPAR